MKEEVSEYYKSKGYSTVYITTNKEPRRVATLRMPNGKMTSMSYAKYIYTSHHKVDVDGSYYHVDHINGNKLDDSIENLQVISGRYNMQKDHPRKEMVILVCPVCKTEFLFPKNNLPFHQNPCCCRRCGGIKSHLSKSKYK